MCPLCVLVNGGGCCRWCSSVVLVFGSRGGNVRVLCWRWRQLLAVLFEAGGRSGSCCGCHGMFSRACSDRHDLLYWAEGSELAAHVCCMSTSIGVLRNGPRSLRGFRLMCWNCLGSL